MRQGLLAELVPPGVDDYELLGLLQEHYGMPGASGRNESVYPSSRDYVVKIHWRDGRVTSLERGPQYSAAHENSLREAVQTQLVESPGTVVTTWVLFSSPRIVNGYFRSDQLQILPPSAVAPRPRETMGEHPFHLEFAVRESRNGFITNMRRRRVAWETALILNVLLRTQVKAHGVRSKKMWVLCGHADEIPHGRARRKIRSVFRRLRSYVQKMRGLPQTDWHVHWSQEFYIDPRLPGIAEGLSSPRCSPLAQVPHEEYYGADLVPGDDYVVAPDSLNRMLQAVAQLEHKERRAFMRASAWLAAANELWDDHVSSWYVGLVAAIEALLGGEDAERCPECGQVRNVGDRFRAFVERYVPASTDEPTRARLYGLRSALAHGRSLLHIDETPWSGLINPPNALDQDETYRSLGRLVKRVLVGWLWELTSAACRWVASTNATTSSGRERVTHAPGET